jgi:acyl-CoA hydrolase
MEVGVRVTAERWNETDPPMHVASAYLVFVAVDDEGRPRDVPAVLPESDEDRRRFAEAQIRRQHRLARRDEIERLRSGEG